MTEIPLADALDSRLVRRESVRFISVKGRVAGANTVTKSEILTDLNKPEDFLVAIRLVDGDRTDLHQVRSRFQRSPDFGITSVHYGVGRLLAQAEYPL